MRHGSFLAIGLLGLGTAMLAQGRGAVTVTVRVVSAETGRPIPNAHVAFNSERSPDSFRDETTDAQGVAVLKEYLTPGRHDLYARASGYRSTSLGEEPNLGGTVMSISANQPPMTLTIALHRGSTIAGVVTNDLKEPVIGAQVRAIIRRSVGDRRFMATETAKTDDRGAYRIIGLEAGQYFVNATDGLSVAFATSARTPGTPRAILVGVDATQTGVNIQTKPSPSGTITGSLTGPGTGAPGLSALLLQETGAVGFWPVTSARVEPGGQFSMSDVPTGRYILVVRPGAIPAPLHGWARADVIVGADNSASPTLAIHPGARISGTIAPGPARVTVEIAPLGTDHPEAITARTAPGGAGPFVIPNVAPGRYRWMPIQNSPDVLSAFINDRDVTDVPLEIAPDATLDNVRITITSPARVSGTMLDATGKPTSRGAVIVASTAPRDWTEATRRIRLGRPDTAGGYAIASLPPGQYTVSAVTALAPGQLWDPAFLRTLAKSPQVTLTAGQTATVDLRLK